MEFTPGPEDAVPSSIVVQSDNGIDRVTLPFCFTTVCCIISLRQLSWKHNLHNLHFYRPARCCLGDWEPWQWAVAAPWEVWES